MYKIHKLFLNYTYASYYRHYNNYIIILYNFASYFFM